MNKSWIKIPFIYLLIVALLGVLLRLMFFSPVQGVNFKYFLHAHSHVALLGWLYTSLFIVLLLAFITKEDRNKRTFVIQFWLSQIAVVGMLFSFPVQGYAAASITFSTMHILLSYWFIYSFLKNAANNNLIQEKHRFSFTFIKWSLFFMALSSVGPWALGPIMATGNSGSNIYYLSIYFYLHFQYNGWFTFAVFGLFFWWLEKNEIQFSKKYSRLFSSFFVASSIPSYALSALWTQPPLVVYLIGGIAATGQLCALYFFVKLLWQIRSELRSLIKGSPGVLMSIVLFSLVMKLLLQFASAFPLFADLAYKIRNFVIGYLHLVLIGFVSLFIFAFFHLTGLINLETRTNRLGLFLFIAGFFLSELLLFSQGIFFWRLLGSIPYYYEGLFWVSLLMPAGAVLFVLSSNRPFNKKNLLSNPAVIRLQ